MRICGRILFNLAGLLVLASCAGMPAAPRAPAPEKTVDIARLFTGRWYEIARTPMRITDGCVAGTTDFYRDTKGRLHEFDACQMHTPEGRQKSIQGPITFLNPGDNTKFVVHYHVFYGLIPITRTYWVLDHGADYRWFIFTGPDFKNMSVFTRTPRPSEAEIRALTARAKALGYDTSKLEYPAEFPPGAG